MVSTEQIQQLLEAFRATGARNISIYPAGKGRLYVTVQMQSDDDLLVAAAALGLGYPAPVVGGNHRWMCSEARDLAGLSGINLELNGPHTVTVDAATATSEVAA